MVIFHQDHVVQPEPVVLTAAGDDRGLFQCSQAWSCFPRVQYFGGMIPDRVDKLARQCCDAAETLQKIQCDTFRLKNRTRQSADFDNYLAGGNFGAVPANNLCVGYRLDLPENFGCRSGTGDDCFFMRNDTSRGGQTL